MKETSLFKNIEQMCRERMALMGLPEYYFSYLSGFPEKQWFYASNDAKNKLPNMYDVLTDFANRGLIEMITIPMYIQGNCSGVTTKFRYRLDCQYDFENPGIKY